MLDDKEARHHLAIVEIGAARVVDLLGFPPDFKFKGAEFKDGILRIKLQHPSLPFKPEGECIAVLPLFFGD